VDKVDNDPKTCVLDRFSQTNDIPNLILTDGAQVISSASQNPSLNLHGAHRSRLCDGGFDAKGRRALAFRRELAAEIRGSIDHRERGTVDRFKGRCWKNLVGFADDPGTAKMGVYQLQCAGLRAIQSWSWRNNRAKVGTATAELPKRGVVKPPIIAPPKKHKQMTAKVLACHKAWESRLGTKPLNSISAKRRRFPVVIVEL